MQGFIARNKKGSPSLPFIIFKALGKSLIKNLAKSLSKKYAMQYKATNQKHHQHR